MLHDTELIIEHPVILFLLIKIVVLFVDGTVHYHSCVDRIYFKFGETSECHKDESSVAQHVTVSVECAASLSIYRSFAGLKILIEAEWRRFDLFTEREA